MNRFLKLQAATPGIDNELVLDQLKEGFYEIALRLDSHCAQQVVVISIRGSQNRCRRYLLRLRSGVKGSRLIRLTRESRSVEFSMLDGSTISDREQRLTDVTLQRFPFFVVCWIVWQRLRYWQVKIPRGIIPAWRAYSNTLGRPDISGKICDQSYQNWICFREPRLLQQIRNSSKPAKKPAKMDQSVEIAIIVLPPANGPSNKSSINPRPQTTADNNSIENLVAGHPIHLFDLTGDPNQCSAFNDFLQNCLEKSDIRRYFWFLQPGDKLSPQAIPLLLNALQTNPDVALLYTDEDQLRRGQRTQPHLKPDWNPEFFLESGYLGRSVLFGESLLEGIDAPLIFFADTTEAISSLLTDSSELLNATDSVHHIPYICLHRADDDSDSAIESPDSTAMVTTSPTVVNAQGSEVMPSGAEYPEIKEPQDGILKVGKQVVEKTAVAELEVAILIPTRDQVSVLKTCIDSVLQKTSYQNYKILVVDNQSRESDALKYLSEITEHPQVQVLPYDRAFNYSAINNFAARHTQADVLLLMNNDIEVISSDWLQVMVQHCENPKVGCVGAKLYYPDGSIQHGGVVLGLGVIAGHAHRFQPGDSDGYMKRLRHTQRVSAVTGACLAVRRSLYMDAGGLNELNLPVAYNDVDFCLKVSALGYHHIWTPRAELYHHESFSRGRADTSAKKRVRNAEVAYMRRKWKNELRQDPYYHPGLTSSKEDFSLRI